MRSRGLAAACLLAAAGAGLGAGPASAYQVHGGDTLWSISRRTGVAVDTIVRENRISNPDRIYPGQQLRLEAAPPPAVPAPAAPPPPPATSREVGRAIVTRAALQQGLNPNFALAVADWESGLDQSRVSGAGAVGLMQVMPATADWAGPALLGRRIDLRDAQANALLGCALLRRYLVEFGDPKLALAAYYQGAAAVHRHGIYPGSRGYVDGIWALRNRLEASRQ